MPVYNTKTVANALHVTPKWLDNLLSHNNIVGTGGESQGVARRLPLSTVTVIALARELIAHADLSVPAALKLSTRLLDNPEGELALSPVVRLSVDMAALRATLLSRLAHAIETAPTPHRGRPPKR